MKYRRSFVTNSSSSSFAVASNHENLIDGLSDETLKETGKLLIDIFFDRKSKTKADAKELSEYYGYDEEKIEEYLKGNLEFFHVGSITSDELDYQMDRLAERIMKVMAKNDEVAVVEFPSGY
ncbi:MAG: hypothetical protein FWG65_07040 [Turicibacter sp.]|nr:hypothetical protein [Turicibacter sp.]